ncbi:MAG: hypothetical protein AAFU54_17415 [Chloroflexota bacterium]
MGYRVVITHGNGPQVGYILRRGEIAAQHGIHDVPLDLVVADTQGSIGYMLQQALDNSLRRIGLSRSIVTMVTQTRVSKDDPAFQHPTKPIGGFMTEEEARKSEAEGWHHPPHLASSQPAALSRAAGYLRFSGNGECLLFHPFDWTFDLPELISAAFTQFSSEFKPDGPFRILNGLRM